MNSPGLGEMLLSLHSVDDVSWGRYAFSSDLLRNRIPLQQQDEMTRKAIDCGEEWALRMIRQTGAADPDSMLKSLDLTLMVNDADMMDSPRQLFAQFVPDKGIEIMSQPIEIYSSMYHKEAGSIHGPLFPPPEQVRELLLAHELFHYVEECHKKEIYSRTETILLWKFFRIKWNSTIRSLSEIAAMSFAKALTRSGYSPFVLDVMLLYGYNKALARSVFKRIMGNCNA